MKLIQKTIGQCLKEQAEQNGSLTALQADGCRINFRQLDRITDWFATKLQKLDIAHGTHVGIWGTNSAYWVFLFLALVKIGAVPILINTCYKRQELTGILDYADVEVLFYGNGYKDTIYEEVISHIRSDLKKLRYQLPLEPYGPYPHVPDLDSTGAAACSQAQVRPEDIACMIFTSGTTALPKGVMLSHYNLVNNSLAMIEGMHWQPGERMCIAVPLFHCFGITAGIIACILGGISMHLIPHFKTAQVWKALCQEHCTILNGVPSMFLALIRKPEYSSWNADHLKSGMIAGSPITQEEYLEICERFPQMHLQPAYGQTETSPCVTLTAWDEPKEEKAVSAGSAIDHVRVRIADPQTGESLKSNQNGEIQVQGYNVMSGYYHLPQATNQAFTHDGWLKTGDIGYMDERQELHITGRLKEIIIRSGENIAPQEIEQVIRQLPWIADVKILGIPAAITQEEIAACIIPRSGYSCNEQELKAFVGQHLSLYKIPAFVLKFDEFPLNASGKIHLKALRDMAIQQIGQHQPGRQA